MFADFMSSDTVSKNRVDPGLVPRDEGYSSPHEFYSDFFKKLREMGHPGKNVTRIRMGTGLLILRDDKIIANFKDGYHTTIYYDVKNRIFGAHRTQEGQVNIHEDRVEYDVGRLREEDFQRVNQASWRWVEVGDPHFSDLRIEVAKQSRDFPGLYQVRRNEAVLDNKVAEKLAANMERVTLEEFHYDNYRMLANFLRDKRRMTSREIAELLRIDPSSVEKWESMDEKHG